MTMQLCKHLKQQGLGCAKVHACAGELCKGHSSPSGSYLLGHIHSSICSSNVAH